MANFVAKFTEQVHTCESINCTATSDKEKTWKEFVDGSSNLERSRIGVLIMKKKNIPKYLV